MIPYYFPYTYISRQTAAILHGCFGPVGVYQPCEAEVPDSMRQLAAEGFIALRVPFSDSGNQLANILKDYRNWANLQRTGKGIDTAYLKTLKDRLPFFDDTAPEQIRSMIKGQMADRSSANVDAGPTEKILKAQIFLQLAQEFDVQNDTVREEMVRCSQMERALMDGIHGETSDTDPLSLSSEISKNTETADYMIEQRLEAWATLMLADAIQAGPDAFGIFITCNQSAFDLIETQLPQTRKVAEWAIPAVVGRPSTQILEQQQALMDQLNALLSADLKQDAEPASKKFATLPSEPAAYPAAAGRMAVNAQIYVIPEQPPATVFAASAPGATPTDTVEAPTGLIRNTIVVVVGPVGR